MRKTHARAPHVCPGGRNAVKAAALSLAFMCAAGGATADVIAVTARSNIHVDTDGYGYNSFAAFNPALGSLTGATVQFYVSHTFGFFGGPYAASAITEQVNFDVAGAFFVIRAPAAGSGTASVSATLAIPAANLPGLQGWDAPFRLDVEAFTLAPATLYGEAAAGGGTDPFTIYSLGNAATGWASMRYEFTPVPEPGALALLAAGLLGLIGVRHGRAVMDAVPTGTVIQRLSVIVPEETVYTSLSTPVPTN